jgi:hypothetical protein
MDLQQGVLCNLTLRKPDFGDECPTYNEDVEAIAAQNQIVLENEEENVRLSPDQHEKLRSEQNYQVGLLVTIIVGLVGAGLWAAVTVATGYQIGYLALALGAGVGFSMRIFGKGVDQIFGITGAIIALVSCVLGNFFSIIAFLADYENLSFFEALSLFDYSQLIPVMQEGFSPMDLLFYGIAAYEGYKFAFRPVTQEEVDQL